MSTVKRTATTKSRRPASSRSKAKRSATVPARPVAKLRKKGVAALALDAIRLYGRPVDRDRIIADGHRRSTINWLLARRYLQPDAPAVGSGWRLLPASAGLNWLQTFE